MSFHQNLKDVPFICGQIKALDAATFHISAKRGSAKNEMQRLMWDASRMLLEEEIETYLRRLRKLLNDHYATNNSYLFQPPKNDSPPIKDGSNLTD